MIDAIPHAETLRSLHFPQVTASKLLDVPNEKVPLPFKAFERADSDFAMAAEDWERIADLINRAQRPIIYAGQGIISAGAHQELRLLAEKANIPVTTTLQVRDSRGWGNFCVGGLLCAHFALIVSRVFRNRSSFCLHALPGVCRGIHSAVTVHRFSLVK